MEPNQAIHGNGLGPYLDSMEPQFVNNHEISDEVTNLPTDQDRIVGELSRQGLQSAGQIHSGDDHGVLQTIS